MTSKFSTQALDRLYADILLAIELTDWKKSSAQFIIEKAVEPQRTTVQSVTLSSAPVLSANGLWLTVKTRVRTEDIDNSLKCPLLFVTLQAEPGSTAVLASADVRRLFWQQNQDLVEVSEKLRSVARQKIAKRLNQIALAAPVSDKQVHEEQALLAFLEHGHAVSEPLDSAMDKVMDQIC